MKFNQYLQEKILNIIFFKTTKMAVIAVGPTTLQPLGPTAQSVKMVKSKKKKKNYFTGPVHRWIGLGNQTRPVYRNPDPGRPNPQPGPRTQLVTGSGPGSRWAGINGPEPDRPGPPVRFSFNNCFLLRPTAPLASLLNQN